MAFSDPNRREAGAHEGIVWLRTVSDASSGISLIIALNLCPERSILTYIQHSCGVSYISVLIVSELFQQIAKNAMFQVTGILLDP
jgi:hypothetical protein